MIVSYDIDGVLAEKPPPSEIKWGKMKKDERESRRSFLCYWYKNARPLLIPSEEMFYAISARKNDPETIEATRSWLKKYYDKRVIGFCLLGKSRTIKNVSIFKSESILSLGVKRHYEDNKKVLSEMRRLLPFDVELYFWERGMKSPTQF